MSRALREGEEQGREVICCKGEAWRGRVAGRPGGGHCTCEMLVPLGGVVSIPVVRGVSGSAGSGRVSFTCLLIFLSLFGCSLRLSGS